MNIFSYIFQKLIQNKKKNNNILLFNFECSIKFLRDNNMLQKFKIFDKQIINNRLLSKSEKIELLNIFYLTQKYYHILNNFSFKYKIKKSKFSDNNEDFFMTPFTTLSESILINIYHNRINYRFRISDIINIINNNLSYMDNYINIIKDVKNPYNNVKFEKGILYYIYYKIKNSSYIMPYLFHLYFLSNFDKELFYRNNECLIKNYSIDKHCKRLENKEKGEIIYEMLQEFRGGYNVLYDQSNMEKDINYLIPIFEGCIKDYLYIHYSNNSINVNFAKENLKEKLINISQKKKFNFIIIKMNFHLLRYIDNHISNNLNRRIIEFQQNVILNRKRYHFLDKYIKLFFVIGKVITYYQFSLFIYYKLF